MVVKRKKLKYQPIWDAVRNAYPNLSHADVDSESAKIYACVKFDSVKYQEKLTELQEEAARGKRKRLQQISVNLQRNENG